MIKGSPIILIPIIEYNEPWYWLNWNEDEANKTYWKELVQYLQATAQKVNMGIVEFKLKTVSEDHMTIRVDISQGFSSSFYRPTVSLPADYRNVQKGVISRVSLHHFFLIWSSHFLLWQFSCFLNVAYFSKDDRLSSGGGTSRVYPRRRRDVDGTNVVGDAENLLRRCCKDGSADLGNLQHLHRSSFSEMVCEISPSLGQLVNRPLLLLGFLASSIIKNSFCWMRSNHFRECGRMGSLLYVILVMNKVLIPLVPIFCEYGMDRSVQKILSDVNLAFRNTQPQLMYIIPKGL